MFTFILFVGFFSLKVQVINKTDSTQRIPNSYISLIGLNSNGDAVFKDSMRISSKGVATFKVKDTTLFYVALFKYKGTLYMGKNDVPGVKPIKLEIYEPTRDSSKLKGLGYHILIMPTGKDTVSITEIQQVSFDTNCTYKGEPVVKFYIPNFLPGTFIPFIPSDTLYWQIRKDTVSYTGPLYPGKQIVAFSYRLPYRDGLIIHRVLPVSVGVAEVLLAEPLKVKTSNLKYQGIKRISNQKFYQFYGANLNEISLKLTTRLPGPGKKLTWLLFGIVVVLSILLIYLRITREKSKEEEE